MRSAAFTRATSAFSARACVCVYRTCSVSVVRAARRVETVNDRVKTNPNPNPNLSPNPDQHIYRPSSGWSALGDPRPLVSWGSSYNQS